MTQRNADRPVLTALGFVAGAAMLAAILASQMPNTRLNEIIQTSAAAEAALDPISIGYSAPVVAAIPAATITRVGLSR